MRCKEYFMLFAILLICGGLKVTADESRTTDERAARSIVEVYKDVPKGVVLEGSAGGFEPLQTLAYDKDKNTFLINGKSTYTNPVSRKDFAKVFKAVLKDDRLGVTLVNGEIRTYGDLSAESEMAKELSDTDRFLGGIIYGIDRLLDDRKLPGNYKTQRAESRTVAVVAFTSFTDYSFEKKGNEYKRAGLSLSIMLIPLSEKKTANGGHLPDEPKLKTYQMEKADKANIDHLKSNQNEYIKMPELSKTVAWGEATAFARYVRDSAKIDGEEFLKQLK